MLREAEPLELEADAEEAVTVAVAARRLGVDEATVRAMLRAGEIEGFKAGKGRDPGGVRIEAESIRAYKRRHRIGGTPANDGGRPKRRTVNSSGHTNALRALRAMGVIS